MEFRDSYHSDSAREPLGQHIDTMQLLRWAEGDLSDEEMREVQRHLLQCKLCYRTATAVFQQMIDNKDRETLEQYQHLPARDPERVLQRLFPAAKAPKPATRPVWQPLADWLDRRLAPAPGWKLAASLAVLALVVLIWGKPHYNSWRSEKYARQAFEQMAAAVIISDREAVRPSGGFAYSEFGTTRGSGKMGATRPGYVRELEKAVKLDPRNARALEFLGTYYLYVAGSIDRAEAYYQRALEADPKLASVHNDLGVLYWQKGDYRKALQQFNRAHQLQPAFAEALYNLAMAQQHFPELQAQAIESWQAYLKLDSTSDWSQIARMNLNKLQVR